MSDFVTTRLDELKEEIWGKDLPSYNEKCLLLDEDSFLVVFFVVFDSNEKTLVLRTESGNYIGGEYDNLFPCVTEEDYKDYVTVLRAKKMWDALCNSLTRNNLESLPTRNLSFKNMSSRQQLAWMTFCNESKDIE